MKTGDEGRKANRLARETSPYLLQHAHNPVDWRPWGEGAFAEARARGVPLFLSIGYSTCYWCHVMERESFEDEATAGVLNRLFVPVKVDREERPDVDDVYMAAVQISTGHGGWPMSVFLEPEGLRPFYCGTYFPPEPRHGMTSFRQVLEGIGQVWREQREGVLKQAESIAGAVREHLASKRDAVHVGVGEVSKAASALLTMFDRVRGGFGGAPKFPQPTYLDFLLEFLPFAGEEEAREAVEAAARHTLDRMAVGGLFDQAGGGFHRYSVDAEWTVPHFEKMLYDNALLASVYARAARRFGDEFYAGIARRTLEYVLREMTAAEGGFFSAQDAEVDGREGLNYLWTPEEVGAALPAGDAAFALDAYGLNAGPNFKDPHHPDAPAANVLRLEDRPDRLAVRRGEERAEFGARLARVNAGLLAARDRRKPPRLDDKVLAAWNGLMIGAMAVAGRELGESRYVDAAERAAKFVLAKMRDGKGLLRAWRAGEARVPAFLEDYADVAQGLIELHRAGRGVGGRSYLAEAVGLVEEAERRFGDGAGGFFDTVEGRADLFVRPRTTYDGAVPSGVSVMIQDFLDLHEATGERVWLERAARGIASVSAEMPASPLATINSTRGLLRALAADSGAVASVLPPARARTAEAAGGEDFTPVVVFASEERVSVGEGAPAEVHLRLQIAEGYHINAAVPAPGDEKLAGSLVGVRVRVVGGTGVAAYADYPEGEKYGERGELRVHRGVVEFPVALERTGAAVTGRLLLTVTFQACTETECLAPRTVELDVGIDAE